MNRQLMTALLLSSALAGCHGQHVTRIEVAPTTVLLTGAGQTHAFTAQAFDEDGKPMKASFSWRSSNAASVSVDANGLATAQVSLGSGQVIASASGVDSQGALVAIVEPAPGAILVSDAQVVAGPDAVDPANAYPLGAQSTLTLSGVNGVAPGALLIASETKRVGGRVVSVTDLGGGRQNVVIESVTLQDLFAHFSIDASGPVEGEDTPQPLMQAARSRAVEIPSDTYNLGPLRCRVRGTFSTVQSNFTYSMVRDLTWNVHLMDADGTTVSIAGPLTLTAKYALKFGPEMSGTLTCRLELLRFPIPIEGALAAVMDLEVPIGVKFEANLTAKAPNAQLGVQTRYTANLRAGFHCDWIQSSCEGLNDFNTKVETTPIFEATSLKSFHLDGNLGLYAYVGLDVGFPVLQALTGVKSLSILEAYVGLRKSMTLAFRDDQADDSAYASSYDFKIYGELGFGTDAKMALNKLGDFASFKNAASYEDLIAKSPAGGWTVDKTQTPPGQPVAFQIDMDPDRLTFDGAYNVETLEIYRMRPGQSSLDDAPIASLPASTGQKSFTWTWTPGQADVGANRFYAFVRPIVLGSVAFEIRADTKLEVDVLGAGHVKVSIQGTRSEDFPYTQGTGSETTTIDFVQDFQVTGQPVFAGGPTPVGNSDYLGMYTVVPQTSGVVKHHGVKSAVLGCMCYPGSTATVSNSYDGELDYSTPMSMQVTYLTLDVPVGSVSGATNLAVAAAGQPSETGQISHTGCPFPDLIKPVTDPINMTISALPAVSFAVPDPSKPQHLTGTITVPNMVATVNYPSMQSEGPASWTVPLTVTIEYDLPWNPIQYPKGPSAWLSELVAATLASGAPTVPAQPIAIGEPIYFGTRPSPSGRSVPVQGLFAVGTGGTDAVLCR